MVELEDYNPIYVNELELSMLEESFSSDIVLEGVVGSIVEKLKNFGNVILGLIDRLKKAINERLIPYITKKFGKNIKVTTSFKYWENEHEKINKMVSDIGKKASALNSKSSVEEINEVTEYANELFSPDFWHNTNNNTKEISANNAKKYIDDINRAVTLYSKYVKQYSGLMNVFKQDEDNANSKAMYRLCAKIYRVFNTLIRKFNNDAGRLSGINFVSLSNFKDTNDRVSKKEDKTKPNDKQ